MRAAPLAAAALLAAGCAGELVEMRRRVKGPVPEVGWLDPGGGHAKYSLAGGKWAVEERRKDALAKIGAYCGGKYRVVDELDRAETETPFTADLEENVAAGSKHYRKADYRHLYFECGP